MCLPQTGFFLSNEVVFWKTEVLEGVLEQTAEVQTEVLPDFEGAFTWEKVVLVANTVPKQGVVGVTGIEVDFKKAYGFNGNENPFLIYFGIRFAVWTYYEYEGFLGHSMGSTWAGSSRN